MDITNMKNMVVLRNLPSNIVDEAFVVLKSSKKVKRLEKIENNKNSKIESEVPKGKDYVLKEAEMLVSDYISKIEDNDKRYLKKEEKSPKKYKKLAYISTIVAVLECIILISSYKSI